MHLLMRCNYAPISKFPFTPFIKKSHPFLSSIHADSQYPYAAASFLLSSCFSGSLLRTTQTPAVRNEQIVSFPQKATSPQHYRCTSSVNITTFSNAWKVMNGRQQPCRYAATQSASNISPSLLDKYDIQVSRYIALEESFSIVTLVARHKLASSLADMASSAPDFRQYQTDMAAYGDQRIAPGSSYKRKPILDLPSAIQAVLLKFEELKSSIPSFGNITDPQPVASAAPTTAYLWFSNHLSEWYSHDNSILFSKFTNMNNMHLYFSSKGISGIPYLGCSAIQSSEKNPLLYFQSEGSNFPSQLTVDRINQSGLYLCFSSQPSSVAVPFFMRLRRMCINSYSVLMHPRSMWVAHGTQFCLEASANTSEKVSSARTSMQPYKGLTLAKDYGAKSNKVNFTDSAGMPHTCNRYSEAACPSKSPSMTEIERLETQTPLRTPVWCSYYLNRNAPALPPMHSHPSTLPSAAPPPNSPTSCRFFLEVQGNCGIFIPGINALDHATLISTLLFEKGLDPVLFHPRLARKLFESPSVVDAVTPSCEQQVDVHSHARSYEQVEVASHRRLAPNRSPQNYSITVAAYGFQLIKSVPIYTLNSPVMPGESCRLQLLEPRFRILFKHALKNNGYFGWISLTDSLQAKKETVGVYLRIERFGYISEDFQVFVTARAVGRFVLDERDIKMSEDPANFGLKFHNIYIFDDDPPRTSLQNEAWVQEGLRKAKVKYARPSIGLTELSFLIEDRSADLFLSSISVEARLKAILMQDVSELDQTSVFKRANIPTRVAPP